MRWFENLKLRYRLIFIFLLITIIPMITLITLSYRSHTNEIKNNYIKSNSLLLDQVNNRLDDYFQQLDQISMSIFTEDIFYSNSQNEQPWMKYSRNIRRLWDMFLKRKEIHSIVYYLPESNETYIVNKSINHSFENDDSIEQMQWFIDLIKSKEFVVTQASHLLEGYPENYYMNSNVPVISINRLILINSQLQSVLQMNYKLDFIQEICSETLLDDSENIYYLSGQNELYYSSESEKFIDIDKEIVQEINSRSTESGFLEYQNSGTLNKFLIIYLKSKSGNILYKVIPISTIFAHAKISLNSNIMIGVFLLVALIVSIIIISFKITKPLIEIERNMLKLGEGDFSRFISITKEDEIGKIAAAFNGMAHKINKLINEKYSLTLLYKSAQLESLQAQINPHFIHNTLQAIGSVALENEVFEIEKITRMFSKMIRYNMNSNIDVATIYDEIENIKNYLYIQKYRFEEKLKFEISIPDEIVKYKIPKLILQPIVENSIIHGIEPKKTTGTVSISGLKINDIVIFEIQDDGVGIDKFILDKIFGKIEKDCNDKWQKENHVGLANVMCRLKLAYNGASDLAISSNKGIGTQVKVTIPVNDYTAVSL